MFLIRLFGFLFVLSLLSCQSDPGRRHRFDKEGLEGGELIFEENFRDQSRLERHWNPWPHPHASLKEGWVILSKNKNDPPLWLDKPLPPYVRIEFDAKALSKYGDIKFEIFGNGDRPETGYVLVFGAHRNAEDWMTRLGEHNKDRKVRKSQGVKKDKIYHMTLVRTRENPTLRWFIDGKPFFQYIDSKPLMGEGHQYFALNDWEAPIAFSHLKIYRLP